MVNQMEKESEIREVYAKIKSHKKPYSINVSGVKIRIFPNVFSPAYYTDSEWFAKTVTKIVGKNSLLEIGTGTGIIALFVGLNGAEVTVTDINPDAIKNAIYNFDEHEISIKTFCGNMFEPLPPDIKFDFIFWNHPFNKGENPHEEILLKAGFDYKYKDLERYFAEAHEHLNSNGRLLLGTGNLALLSEIERLAAKYGYKMILLERIEIPNATNSALDIHSNDFRIYEFVK